MSSKETKVEASAASEAKTEDPFDELVQASFPALGMEAPRVHAIYKFLAYEPPNMSSVPIVPLDAEGRRRVLAARASNLAGRVTTDRKAILGDYIKFERLDAIFMAAFSKTFKHCSVQDVAAGKSFKEELVYDFGDPEPLSWRGCVETKSWHRTRPVLGLNAWKEYKITLVNDGFLFLEPRLLNIDPLDETFDHHPKYQTRTKWYVIDREDVEDHLPHIFAFGRQFFPTAELEILIFLTSDAQALDIEFYHVAAGVVLTVQFEIGFPERAIDPSWFRSRKSKALK